MKHSRKILSFTASFAITTVFITGCSTKKETMHIEQKKIKEAQIKLMTTELSNLPSWVLKPQIKGSLSAVGISSYSKHGIHSMLAIAEMDAKAKIAGKIQTTLSQLQQKSMRQLKVNKIDDMENMFRQVTKEVIKNIPLSGVQRESIFQDKKGNMYVLMSVDNNKISDYLSTSKSQYQKHMQEANMTRENIDKGMVVLDNMIDKLEKEID